MAKSSEGNDLENSQTEKAVWKIVQVKLLYIIQRGRGGEGLKVYAQTKVS